MSGLGLLAFFGKENEIFFLPVFRGNVSERERKIEEKLYISRHEIQNSFYMYSAGNFTLYEKYRQKYSIKNNTMINNVS